MDRPKRKQTSLNTFFKKAKVVEDESGNADSDRPQADTADRPQPADAQQLPVVEPAAGGEAMPINDFSDVGVFKRAEINEADKIPLLKSHFHPDRTFKFPVRQHKQRNLKFNYSWLDQLKWLVYSKSQNGGYCLPCVLFAHNPGGRGCHFGALIERPFTDFRKALGKEGILSTHEQTAFHKSSIVAADTLLRTHDKPEDRIDFKLGQQSQQQFDVNKAALSSIVDCIIYLGHQCSPLRGHRDDSTADATKNKGNLHALIEFRAKTDENLKIFLDTCPGNARYTSKTIQNEILDVIKDLMQETITSHINDKQCPFYSIIADELTDDIANQHILSLCIRYLIYDGEDIGINEGLLDFTYVSRGTAAHLVETIKEQLVKCGLKVENVRGQAYDTTSAMSSDNRGLQGLFRRDVPNAIYTPCNSHKLNLVIASASKLQQIKKCITEVNETYLFFNASHKRQGFLERVIDIVVARDRQLPEGRKHTEQHKLKGLCKTRWVARFEAIDNFIDLSSSVQTVCDIIINPHLYVDDEKISQLINEAWNWDGDTKTRAQGILATFGNFEFLVSLVVLRNVLQPLREITTRLQKRDLDIRSAYTSLAEVHKDIEALRADIDTRFRLWYVHEVLVLAKELGVEERVPRAKGRNAYRATHPAESTMEYFKRSIAIPFIDDVNAQMHERFARDSTSTISALFNLLPSLIIKTDVPELSKLAEDLGTYRDDLPRFKSLRTELEIWRAKCLNMTSPADSLLQALRSCSQELFPNLVVLLQIACVIPVTSCEAERSFSAVRRHKTVLRSTMGEDRLTSLVLMNMYYDTPIPTDKVVQMFIQKHPRRLFSHLFEKA